MVVETVAGWLAVVPEGGFVAASLQSRVVAIEWAA
jgi:hypothetical protein